MWRCKKCKEDSIEVCGNVKLKHAVTLSNIDKNGSVDHVTEVEYSSDIYSEIADDIAHGGINVVGAFTNVVYHCWDCNAESKNIKDIAEWIEE